MNPILALDTSTRKTALAVFESHSGRAWTATDVGTQNHGRQLIPAIELLMKSSGLRLADLRAIVVGTGPGSYTGLRVGIAVAKTLAEVMAIPVYSLDSLILPVLATPLDPHAIYASIADAQRGAVALSIYKGEVSSGRWIRHSGPEILDWDLMKQACRSAGVTKLTGPGLDLTPRLGQTGFVEAPVELRHPGPEALVAWLRTDFALATPVDPDMLEPEYLRPSAAEEKRQPVADSLRKSS